MTSILFRIFTLSLSTWPFLPVLNLLQINKIPNPDIPLNCCYPSFFFFTSMTNYLKWFTFLVFSYISFPDPVSPLLLAPCSTIMFPRVATCNFRSTENFYILCQRLFKPRKELFSTHTHTTQQHFLNTLWTSHLTHRVFAVHGRYSQPSLS